MKAKDEASFKALISLYEKSTSYDFWTEPRNNDRSVDIMLPPANVDTFVNFFQSFRMDYRVKIEDVQRYLRYQISNA